MISKTFNRNEDNFTPRYVVISLAMLITFTIFIMLINYALKLSTASTFHAHKIDKNMDHKGATSTANVLKRHTDNYTFRYVVTLISLKTFYSTNTYFAKSSIFFNSYASRIDKPKLMHIQNIEGAIGWTLTKTNSAVDNNCSLLSKRKLSAAAGQLPNSFKTNARPSGTRGGHFLKSVNIVISSRSRIPLDDPGASSIPTTGDHLLKRFTRSKKENCCGLFSNCRMSKRHEVKNEFENIINLQSLFSEGHFGVPMVIITVNEDGSYARPAFEMDIYEKWNEHQVLKRYSNFVGRSIADKIENGQTYNVKWFKDRVLELVRDSIVERIDYLEQHEIQFHVPVTDPAQITENHKNFLEGLQKLRGAIEKIKEQLKADKTVEFSRICLIPGSRVPFDVYDKTFHWVYSNCFSVSSMNMTALDQRVLEESLNWDIIDNVRLNHKWIHQTVEEQKGIFVDTAGHRRAIIIKDTKIKKEFAQLWDLLLAKTHYRKVDPSAFAEGPTTRGNHLERKHEHVALPENYDDEKEDPDPEDKETCYRVAEGEDSDDSTHRCEERCEYCRFINLNGTYFREMRYRKPGNRLYKTDVCDSSSTSSPNSEAEDAGTEERPKMDHTVGYDKAGNNQPTRPQSYEVFKAYKDEKRLEQSETRGAYYFEDLPPILNTQPPLRNRNQRIVGYLSETEEEHRFGFGYEKKPVEAHPDVDVSSMTRGVFLDYMRMTADMLYGDTIGQAYSPQRIMVQAIENNKGNSVTRRYPDWFNRIRTRMTELNCRAIWAQAEMTNFCKELLFEDTSEKTESEEDAKHTLCPLCEVSDQETVDNHICSLRQAHRDRMAELGFFGKRVTTMPAGDQLTSSDDEPSIVWQNLTSSLKKKKSSGSGNPKASPHEDEYEADNELEVTDAEANRPYELTPAMYSGVDINPYFEGQTSEAAEDTTPVAADPEQPTQAVAISRIERLTQAEGGASDNEVNRALCNNKSG